MFIFNSDFFPYCVFSHLRYIESGFIEIVTSLLLYLVVTITTLSIL